MSKKKLKTGDVVGWAVVDRYGHISDRCDSRKEARAVLASWNRAFPKDTPHRLAKIVLAK